MNRRQPFKLLLPIEGRLRTTESLRLFRRYALVELVALMLTCAGVLYLNTQPASHQELLLFDGWPFATPPYAAAERHEEGGYHVDVCKNQYGWPFPFLLMSNIEPANLDFVYLVADLSLAAGICYAVTHLLVGFMLGKSPSGQRVNPSVPDHRPTPPLDEKSSP